MAGKSAVTLRLGVEGDEKIQAALRKIGQTGDDAMQGLSKEARAALIVRSTKRSDRPSASDVNRADAGLL